MVSGCDDRLSVTLPLTRLNGEKLTGCVGRARKKSVGTAKFARESLLVTYSSTKQFWAETSANLLLVSDVK